MCQTENLDDLWDEAVSPQCLQCGSVHCRCRHTLSSPRPVQATDTDWLDDNAFDDWEMAADADTDTVADAPPPQSTDEVADEIMYHLRRAGIGGLRSRVAFGVEPSGVQAEDTRDVRSFPDGQLVDDGGRRINFEVDRSGNINNHLQDHIRAMRQAIRRGHFPSSAQSVFMTTTNDRQGKRINQIRRVVYETHGRPNIINESLPRHLTVQEVARYLRRGVLPNTNRGRLAPGRQQQRGIR